MTKEKIRLVTKDDFSSMCKIYNQNLGQTTLHLIPVTSEYYTSLLHKMEDREQIYVLEADQIIIGFSVLKLYSPKEGYRNACETSTFLDKNFIGKGYGSMLKKYVLAKAKKMDYTYVVARIMSQNTHSIEFNKKLGFRIVGIQHKIGKIGDNFIDVTVMEKHL